MTADPLFAGPGGATPQVAPIRWYQARVVSLRSETARAKTYRLRLSEPMRFLAGQHVVVRLTAPDGYRAQRSYSIASAPEPDDEATTEIEITVERLGGGEVSTFLHDVVEVGDDLAVRGPIGGWFAWRAQAPAVLVGGGSGVVPLMSMLRLARRSGRPDLPRLLVSVRSPDDLYYRDELLGPEVTVVYTRRVPDGVARLAARLTPSDLAALAPQDIVAAGGSAYVCGSAGFADGVTALLEGAGFPASRIRVERFGATT